MLIKGIGAAFQVSDKWLQRGLIYAEDLRFAENAATRGMLDTISGTKVRGSPWGALARSFGSTVGAGTSDYQNLKLTVLPTAYSIIVRFARAGSGGSGFGRLWHKGDTSTQESILFWSSSGTVGLEFSASFSTVSGSWVFPNTAEGGNGLGVPIVLGISYDTSSISNDPVGFINGIRVALTERVTPAGTKTTAANAFAIGNRVTTVDRAWDGWIGEILIFDRLIPNEWHEELGQDITSAWHSPTTWVPVSAGGSTYPVSLTESATASDAATAAYIAAASVSESITAADSLAAATTWVRSLTEAATAAESITTAGTFAASITEAASTADALTSAVAWARALTEAASASDLATAIRHAVAALTEAATAGDSQTTGSIYTGSLTEAASVSDALTAAATLVALLTEVATASDAATSAATWVRLLTEPATAVDSVAGAQGATYTASVTEVLAAAELLVAVLGSTEALGRYTIAAKARRLTIAAKPRRLEIRK